MLERISYYIKKYESVILYLIFGVLTTLVNFAAYHICYTKLQFQNLVSNTIAWILSVLFAFITNKIWVFKSKSFEFSKLAVERSGFITARFFGHGNYVCWSRYIKEKLDNCKNSFKCGCSYT